MYVSGLGSPASSVGGISDCNSWAYYINPWCWGYARSAWSQMGQFTAQAATLPTAGAPPASANPLISDPAEAATMTPQGVVDATIAAGAADQVQAVTDWAGNTSPVLGVASSGLSLMTWAAIAAGGVGAVLLFGSLRGRRR